MRTRISLLADAKVTAADIPDSQGVVLRPRCGEDRQKLKLRSM